MATNALAPLIKAERMLAEASTLDEILRIENLAARVADYAKAEGLGFRAANQAKKIELDARRKCGATLKLMKQRGELDPGKGGDRKSRSQAGTVKLADLGLTKNGSARRQEEASVPEKVYQQYVQTIIDSGNKELSANGVRKLVRKQKAAKQKAAEEQAASEAGTSAAWAITDSQDVVSCDALITDPPYGILDEPWEPEKLESFTREWATRWATCGADLIAIFWSQRYLWDGRTWLDESLAGYEFQQLLVWHYANNKSPQSRMGFKQTWEPVFLYRKSGSEKQIIVGGGDWGKGLNDFDCHVAAVPQSNFNGADMKQHPAQKPVSVMTWLVNALTRPGELVVDPFCGSGTTGIAAVQIGRRFHGIETDATFAKIAKGRIATYG